MSEEKPLEGKVAVVTGASRGIGRAICVDFARAGADVVVAARSSEKHPSKLPGTIEETARLVEAEGRRALSLPVDVTSEEQVQEMARRTLEEFGKVDVLVNNAGISFPSPLHKTPMKRWDLVLAVNVRGPVLCTQAFMPTMMERKRGNIINISSYLAEVLLPGMLSYSVSKIALEKLTQGVAQELAPYDIGVNALRIELNIVTEGWKFLNPDIDYSDWAKPREASETTLWLATRDASYTGNVVTIAEVREEMAKG
jgi:NAD(P)-dependent dehydrogenase (short-subunit alcohol dehydrogenase family)